ncbi:EF-P lysine aminoacylase EpmA [Geomobilimonas luticola]|uniref:EF-P lysine aminoacylase GenX n=1 Tax=Geomobilimonas luticola TaxID=1114878 RepID=A0ABS5SHS4_9BACT|nr:EF-P lysine aminoacylase EpmA [Geomobilimonas luticola]MBT0654134.1 EF-P lysine aminoacylase GenX [Geomobilimonas luticola]
MNGNWSLAARRNALTARAAIIQEIRRFFVEGGYLEVETPLRIPAPAPEAHIDAIPADGWFLQTSPELCMKRMLAAGYDRLFQVCRCWRAEERGRLHLSEFTMLEWYRANADYRDIMTDCEGLVRALAASLARGNAIRYRGNTIELAGEWERLTVREAFDRYSEISMEEALALDRFDEIMVESIEPKLGMERPTFIHDYPASRGALARLKADDSSVAERFELYIGGLELANAFSELNDPVEQRRRFEQEAALRGELRRQVYPLSEPFLAELATMPPSAGIALGVDRLVMVLLDAARIDDVVAFTPEEL